MSDLPIVKLSEIAIFQTGKLNSNQAVESGQYPFFTCSPETLRINNYTFDCEAVLLAGNNANGIFPVKYYNGRFNAYQRTYVITAKDSSRLDLKYFYYQTQLLASLFTQHSIGTATKFLTLQILDNLSISLPSFPTQRRIAEILGRLDDKIEVNRRINRTLEAMAQALFKHWFVNFGPFQDGPFVESELGLIPEGWEVAPIGQHIEVSKGLSYKGSGLAETGIPLHNLNSVYEGGGYKYEGIKYYTGEYKERHIIKPGDVIIANTEQGFDYLLIGCPAIVPKRYGDFGLFTHHIFKAQGVDLSPLSAHFIYFLLKDADFRSSVTAFTNGTTVNMLSKDGLTYPLIVVPPSEIVQKFDKIAASALARIEVNEEENVKLTTTRDYLLPKLLSGEIVVG